MSPTPQSPPTGPTAKTRTPGRRRFITVRREGGSEEVDLEMPGDRPVGVLLPDLLKTLGWPLMGAGHALHYRLRTEAGTYLGERDTLIDGGVENSDALWIVAVDQPVQPAVSAADGEVDDPAGSGVANGFASVGTAGVTPQERRGNLVPPQPLAVEIPEPALVSETAGLIFVLGKPPILIGRGGRDRRIDIDITEIDRRLAASREHVEIVAESGRFLLVPRRTKNDTYVNGQKIAPGSHHLLSDRDTILFGINGPELTFRLPSK